MKPMSTEELARSLNNATPEKWKTLGPALHLAPDNLTPLKVEGFMRDPEEFPVTPEQHTFLHEWLLGWFVISHVSGEMVRIGTKPAPALMLGIKGGMHKQDPKLVEFYRKQLGEGNTLGATTAATNKGENIPSPDEAQRAKIQREEQAEIAKRKADRKGVVETLMNFGRS